MPVDTQTGQFVNVDVENARTQAAQQVAQQTYWQAMASNAGQQNALTAAQNAFTNALETSKLSGYFGPGVGNGTVAGQPTLPNLQYTTGAFGQYTPGGLAGVTPYTQTQAALQNQQGYGLSQAGTTGVYYDPGNMTYAPGTFIRDPSTNGIGQIQSNGRMMMFGNQGDFLRAGGSWDMVNNPDMMRNVSTQEYNDLASNPNANFGGRLAPRRWTCRRCTAPTACPPLEPRHWRCRPCTAATPRRTPASRRWPSRSRRTTRPSAPPA
jgi:hypothetical protein